MKPKPIKDILLDFLKGSSYKEINDTMLISTAWANIVGQTIFKKTEIKSIKNGRLTIKTANPIWRNELIFQKEDLLNRLKKEKPELYIKEIDFR